MTMNILRPDLKKIVEIIPKNSKVLDIGCGDGLLLDLLKTHKSVLGRGIELNSQRVNQAIQRGVFVMHSDAELELPQYSDKCFDYVILSRTLPTTHNPDFILKHLTRIGQRAIISFPNFAYWKVRWDLLWRGRMPMTGTLAEEWHKTENLHLCTISDFYHLSNQLNINIEQAFYYWRGYYYKNLPFANLLSEDAIFLVQAI